MNENIWNKKEYRLRTDMKLLTVFNKMKAILDKRESKRNLKLREAAAPSPLSPHNLM